MNITELLVCLSSSISFRSHKYITLHQLCTAEAARTGTAAGVVFNASAFQRNCDWFSGISINNIFLDTAQLARIAMDLDFIDETRVSATGGSQGGALSIACAALEPRVSKLATVYPFLCDYKRVWEMDLDLAAYEEIRTYFRMFDPRHEREEEIFTRLGYIDLQFLAPRIKANTVMYTGLMDNICPPSTQYAAYNKMTCPKRHVLYPDYGHEYLRDANDMIYDFIVNG